MRRAAYFAAASLCLLVGAAPASAGTGAPVLLLDFEQLQALDSGDAVLDVSGGGHTGTVRSLNGGRIVPVAGYGGGVAGQLPQVCEGDRELPAVGRQESCPRALVEMADDDDFDPRMGRIQFGARIRLDPTQTSVGGNIIQKGNHGDRAGQWKLQIDGIAGRPSCVISGLRDDEYLRVVVKSPVSVADGDWHSVACERRWSSVDLVIDGAVVETVAFPAVLLDSPSPVRVGGKTVSRAGNDQFHGALDDVFVSRG